MTLEDYAKTADVMEKRVTADETAIHELIRDVREIRDRLYDIELYLQQSPLYRATHKFNEEV